MSKNLQDAQAAAYLQSIGVPPANIPGMVAGMNNQEKSVGSGTAQDLSYGFNVGMAYEISGLTVGAVYKSEIDFDVDDQVTNAVNPMIGGGYTQDEMATPEEYGVGISYTNSGHTIAFDWKYINWEDAEVYQDFEWQDQDVYAIGYEYATSEWAIRCGYQYAESAVEEQKYSGTNDAGLNANLVNTFNLLGFPATQETHISFGGSYAFNETISVDLAAVYGLENEETYTNFMNQDIETKHSEQSYSVQLNYAF
jgi:long-chain fatty acid transport protein